MIEAVNALCDSLEVGGVEEYLWSKWWLGGMARQQSSVARSHVAMYGVLPKIGKALSCLKSSNLLLYVVMFSKVNDIYLCMMSKPDKKRRVLYSKANWSQ